jgi:hypothetical protein
VRAGPGGSSFVAPGELTGKAGRPPLRSSAPHNADAA